MGGPLLIARILHGAETNENMQSQITILKFGEWAEDAKLHGVENLEKFRKAGKYRLHLDKTGMRGSEVNTCVFRREKVGMPVRVCVYLLASWM